MTRELTDSEKQVISLMAKRLAPSQRDQVLKDLDLATVEPEMEDGSRLVFHIAGYERPTYRGHHSFPIEGRALDNDGESLTILLNADENDRLFELEVIRWDSTGLIKPNWESFEITTPPEITSRPE